jgi:hypothetical protein
MKLSVLVFLAALLFPVVSFADTAVLNWVDNSGKTAGVNDLEDGFRIMRQLNGGPLSTVMTVNANVTTWTDNSLAQGMTDNIYCYEVIAFNKIGDAAPSNKVCKTVTAVPPVIPAAASGLVIK